MACSLVRPVIVTQIKLGRFVWTTEMTLADRDAMGFRMLLGLFDPRSILGRSWPIIPRPRRRAIAPRLSLHKFAFRSRESSIYPGFIVKLAILSRVPLAATAPVVCARPAAQRGHKVKVLDTLKFAIDLQPGEPDLYYRGKRLSHYDAVLPRIGASITYFGTAVVRQFEQMDVFTANSSVGIANSRDKLRSLQILSRHHIGIPATTFVKDRTDVLPAIERVGGAPVIIKLLEGTQGIGVILADSVKIAEAIIETLQSTKQNVLLQKFVAESKGRDIRALVVGDQVVAAMRRVAQGSEFRSNVHRGGRTEAGPAGRPVRAKRRSARLKSWVSASPASTCSKAPTARRSWRSIRRRVSKGSKRPPNSTSPARSSTTSPLKSISPNSTSASG